MAAGSADEKQPNTVNAEMRRAIIALVENDDPIMTTIIDSISQAIIAKLVDNTDFAKTHPRKWHGQRSKTGDIRIM